MSKDASPSAEPLTGGGLGLRTVSLPKDEFDSVTNTGPALWRISISARAGGLPGTTPRQSGAAGPSVAVQLEPPSSSKPTGGRRADPPRSIFGLPMLSCRDRYYSFWVLFVLLLDLTYSAFLLPLSVGFQVNDLQWTWACFVDLAAGCVFAVELFLGFHTSYMASNAGQHREVRGGRAVALYYVRYGSFWQDLISTGIWVTQIVLLLVHQAGGVSMAESSSTFQYIRIIRMVRFLYVLRQLFKLTIGSGGGSLIPGLRVPLRWAHALNITYSTVVMLHFFSCLWNFIAIKEDLHATWLNTIAALVRRYSADGASPLTAEELAGVPAAERYVVGLYFSAVTIATLGYGDIVPVNVVEWLVDCVVVAFGVLLFGLAMGSLSDVVASSSKEARQAQLYREKMEGVDAWLHSASVPRQLKHKIRAFYSDVWLKHAAARANVQQEFLELPHSLRQEVAWELNKPLLTRLPLELDDKQRYALAGMMVPLDVAPGQELCMPGDPADSLWLLHGGEVQVFDECSEARAVPAPAVLGVESLLQHVDSACVLRPYGYRTDGPCTLWQLHLEELLPYLLSNVSALDALSARAHAQREAEAEAVAAEAVAEFEFEKREREVWQGHERQAAAATATSASAGPPSAEAAGGHIEQQAAGQCDESCEAGATQDSEQATPQAHGLPCEGQQRLASDHGMRASTQHSGLAAELGAEPSAPRIPSFDLPAARATDDGAAATKGELFQLRAEVVGKLDGLATEVRRYFAVASLAGSAAASGHRHTVAVVNAAGGISPGASLRMRRLSQAGRSDSTLGLLGASSARRGMHWSFGQAHGSP
ncbi:hypothetical protein ABPG75_002852 [Micractinium tetrahymenae]